MDTFIVLFRKRIFSLINTSLSCEMRPIAALLIALMPVLLLTSTATAETTPQSLECKAAPNIGPSVLVCIERDSRPLAPKDYVALLFSGIALLASLASLGYAYRKDLKAREQSIKDDFWIRTIISPIAIEPLIQNITDLMTQLPDDCASNNYCQTSFQSYARDFVTKKQLLSTSLFAFALIDRDLLRAAIQHLDNIEDLVCDYCGANAGATKTTSGQCMYPKQVTRTKVMEQLLALLDGVRTYQLAKL